MINYWMGGPIWSNNNELGTMIIFYHIQIHGGHTKLHCYNIDNLKLKGKAIFLVQSMARKGMQVKGIFKILRRSRSILRQENLNVFKKNPSNFNMKKHFMNDTSINQYDTKENEINVLQA